MAVSRYSTPAQASFMSTYSPIPFNELLQAGLSKQQQYNTGQDYLDSAQTNAENIKYIPGSMDESYIKDNVLATIKETVDEHSSKDFSDPNVMRAITKKLKSIDSQRVNRVQQSAQAYGKSAETRRQLQAAGKYASYLDDTDVSSFSSEFGIYDKSPEGLRPFDKAAESYFNNLKENSYFDKKSGQVISAVTEKDVQSVASRNLDEFLGGPDGKQAVKSMRASGMQGSDEELAYDYLTSRGREFVRRSIGFAPARASKEPTAGITANSYVPGTAVTQVGVGASNRQRRKNTKGIEDYSDYTTDYINNKGETVPWYKALPSRAIKALVKDTHTETLNTLLGKDAVDLANSDIKKQRIFKDEESAMNFENLLVKTAYHNGVAPQDISKMAVDDQDNLIDSYLEDFQTEAKFPDAKEITNPEKTKWLNDVVLGENSKGNKLASLRKWYDPESPAGSVIDFTEIEDEYPRMKDGKLLHNYTISHELSPYNPIMPSAYVVDIEDNTGRTVKQVYMSGPSRNEGSNFLEESDEQNMTKFMLYNQMFSEPTGRVFIENTFKNKKITVEGTALGKGVVSLKVYDSGHNPIGDIEVNSPGATEAQTTEAVIENIKTILSDIK